MAPGYYAGTSQLWFYLQRMALTDPVLSLLFLIGLPGFVAAIRRGDSASSRLLAVWILVLGAALLIFRHRVAYYLLPVVPAVCLVAVGWSPLFKGKRTIVTLAALVIAFGVKAGGGGAVWALDFDRATALKSAASLKRYCQQERSNELVIVSADDEFYSAILARISKMKPGETKILVGPFERHPKRRHRRDRPARSKQRRCQHGKQPQVQSLH